MTSRPLGPPALVAVLHLLYGVALLLLIPGSPDLQPLLAFAWFGTSAMLLVFGMLVVSGHCPGRRSWLLLLLLLPNVAGLWLLAFGG